MKRTVSINSIGRRVGESHHNAKLTEGDVENIRRMLEERERFVTDMKSAGYGVRQISKAAAWQGLGFREIATKFEISVSTLHNIHTGKRRAQTIADFKTIEVPD